MIKNEEEVPDRKSGFLKLLQRQADQFNMNEVAIQLIKDYPEKWTNGCTLGQLIIYKNGSFKADQMSFLNEPFFFSELSIKPA